MPPEAALIMIWDFNQATLRNVLPKYSQNTDVNKQGESLLYHCSSSFCNAYKALLGPPFGKQITPPSCSCPPIGRSWNRQRPQWGRFTWSCGLGDVPCCVWWRHQHIHGNSQGIHPEVFLGHCPHKNSSGWSKPETMNQQLLFSCPHYSRHWRWGGKGNSSRERSRKPNEITGKRFTHSSVPVTYGPCGRD